MLWTRLGIDPLGVVAIVVSAVGVYVVFLLLVRVFGQRPLARMSTADVVVVVALGSITGRVVLGTSVTVTAGAVALLALFLLRWAAERLARTSWGSGLVRVRPVVLMAGSGVLHDQLRRSRVSEDELWGALRAAGVRNRDEVACVVLEATGTVSVLRVGAPLDRQLLAEVEGADAVPPRLFAP